MEIENEMKQKLEIWKLRLESEERVKRYEIELKYKEK